MWSAGRPLAFWRLPVLRYCFGLVVKAFQQSLGQRYSDVVYSVHVCMHLAFFVARIL